MSIILEKNISQNTSKNYFNVSLNIRQKRITKKFKYTNDSINIIFNDAKQYLNHLKELKRKCILEDFYVIKEQITEIKIADGVFTIIDTVMIDSVLRYKWFQDKEGYASTVINKKRVYLHRFLYKTDSNVYHINRNILDNRIRNLTNDKKFQVITDENSNKLQKIRKKLKTKRRHHYIKELKTLLGGKCNSCGLNDIEILQFDHNSDVKHFTIAKSNNKTKIRPKL
jgi:hypothetical protein